MAAWYDGLQLTVTGYVAGIPIAEANFTLTSTRQTQIYMPSNWPLVQSMYVRTSGGTPGPYPSIPATQVCPLF